MSYRKITFIAMIVLCIVFWAFVLLYERHARNEAQSRIDEHARIIAEALWTYNPQGSSEYLTLACRSQNYERLVVTDTNGEVFQAAVGKEPGRFERLLMSLNLIPSVRLVSDVVYGGEKIGEIEAIWNPRAIKVHAYVLFALVMILALFHLYVRILHSKRVLEDGVRERTAELTDSNASLRKEIIERQRVEKVLRESEENLHALVESLTDSILTLDPDRRITSCNSSFLNQFGYSREEVIGHSVSIIHPSRESFDLFGQTVYPVIARNGFWRGEWELKRKDGSIFPGEIANSAMKRSDGSIRGYVSILRDIIERKREQEELNEHRERLEEMVRGRTAELDKRIFEVEELNSAMVNLLADLRVSNENLERTTHQLSDANKELESFSYSVSHDLRAPLRAIDGFSAMLVEDYGDKLDEKGQHELDVIQGSARQMGQLIDDLLAFSRLGRKGMSMSEIDMGVLAQEVFEQLQLGTPGRAVKLKVDTLPSAYGDRAMIREVLVNFLSNAMKFTRPGKAPVIDVTGTVDENENVYSVKDNGVGFDMKYVDKVFQVFQRLHSAEEFEGTGIGLALVQRIIHRHGGRVWAKGKVNKGATFYFSLPAKSD